MTYAKLEELLQKEFGDSVDFGFDEKEGVCYVAVCIGPGCPSSCSPAGGSISDYREKIRALALEAGCVIAGEWESYRLDADYYTATVRLSGNKEVKNEPV